MLEVHGGHQVADKWHEYLVAVSVDDQEVLPGQVENLADVAELSACIGAGSEADQVTVVELLRVGWTFVVVDLGLQKQPTQRIGCGPVIDIGELDEQPRTVPLR
jgi:hypothetical protein